MIQLPELAAHEGSWMLTEIATGDVFEVWRADADTLGKWLAGKESLFRIETAGEYLGRINREQRSLTVHVDGHPVFKTRVVRR
jgi:hypothetical protein